MFRGSPPPAPSAPAPGGGAGGAGSDAPAAGSDPASGSDAGAAAPSAFSAPSTKTFLNNIQFFNDLLGDTKSCPNRVAFAVAACTPAYPLVVGLSWLDVRREEAAAAQKRPMTANLSRMVTIGTLHFFQVAVGMGLFYGGDCAMRQAFAYGMRAGERHARGDGGAAAAKTAPAEVSPANRSPLAVGPKVPAPAPGGGWLIGADGGIDPNLSRTMAGGMAGAVVMATRGFNPIIMGAATGCLLGRYMLPEWEELPGVKAALKNDEQKQRGPWAEAAAGGEGAASSSTDK